MRMILVLGPNSSGKSLYAEKLAVESGDMRIYLATMVPQTKDNYKRIDKHRIQRQDKGFMTIEEPWEILNLDISPDSVVLLEDASNLLANGMFQYQSDGQQALERIKVLARRCKCLIVVSIAGLTDEGYDKETARYIHELNWLNHKLSDLAEIVYVMQDGVPV